MLAAARDKASNVVLSRTQKFMNFVGSFQQVAETQLLGLIALKTVHGILSGNMTLLKSSTYGTGMRGKKRMFALLVVLCRQRLRAILGFAGQSLQELLNPESSLEPQVRRCRFSHLNRGHHHRSERFWPGLHRVHAVPDLIPLKISHPGGDGEKEKQTPALEDNYNAGSSSDFSPRGGNDDTIEEADISGPPDRLCAIPENREIVWIRSRSSARMRRNVVSRRNSL